MIHVTVNNSETKQTANNIQCEISVANNIQSTVGRQKKQFTVGDPLHSWTPSHFTVIAMEAIHSLAGRQLVSWTPAGR